MVDLYVPRSELEAERKLREAAEKRLQSVLEALDPQPDTKGGLIYGAPFPKSGDVAKRVLAIAEEWEARADELAAEELPGKDSDERRRRVAEYGVTLTRGFARELRKAIGAYRPQRTETETKGGVIIPQPAPLETVKINARRGHPLDIGEIVYRAGAAPSVSMARRWVAQGAVSADDEPIEPNCSWYASAGYNFVLKVGGWFEKRVELVDGELEWLRRMADIEDECGGFPSETGVMIQRLKEKK